jgi:LacI family transcriptional regulator
MREVAALAGVSLKTVSRVINGEANVSDELVRRVQSAARLLDYQPNLTASSLRRNDGKTKTIGLLLENVANPFSGALHRAVEDVAHTHGVVVFAGSLDEDPERERELATAFTSRRVDGLIVVPAGPDQSYLIAERRAGTALVFVDRPPSFLDADSVVTANLDGARTAVDHLIKHGHRRIAYLGDLHGISTAVERYDGYKQALNHSDIALDEGVVRQGLHTMEAAREQLLELLDLPNPPTAVFASQNLITIGALRALRERGLQESVAIVGFDDILLADLLQPAVTLVVQDVAEMGQVAAEMLFRRLDGFDGPSEQRVIGTSLVVRGSGELPGPSA